MVDGTHLAEDARSGALSDATREREPAQRGPAVVDGWTINVRTEGELIRRIVSETGAGDGFTVMTLNMDLLDKLRRCALFHQAAQRARYLTADGAPVLRLARRHDPRIELVTGADVMAPLSLAAAKAGLPVFLFGSTDAVLDGVAERLRRDSGGAVAIAGQLSPPRDFDPEGPEADRYIQTIKDSGARIVFVMLGAPKQDIFGMRAVAAGAQAAFLGVGAAGDFLTGAQKRAPALVRRAGFEAVWRFLHAPKRLGLRYLRCARLLAELELKALAGRAKGAAPTASQRS